MKQTKEKEYLKEYRIKPTMTATNGVIRNAWYTVAESLNIMEIGIFCFMFNIFCTTLLLHNSFI